MKTGIALTALAVILAACNEPAPEPKTVAEVLVPLADEAAFRAVVADRELVDSRRFLMIYRADGTMAGDHHGAVIDGRWDWQDAQLCREFSVGLSKYSRRCVAVAKVGDAITFDGPGADPAVRWTAR